MNQFEKYLQEQKLRSLPTEWKSEILDRAYPEKKGFRFLISLDTLLSWFLPKHPVVRGTFAAVWMIIVLLKWTTPHFPPVE